MATLKIKDFLGEEVTLQPRLELYSVTDFMGKEMPGLAVVLDQLGRTPEETEQYAVLTVSFGEFISVKNSAYIDTNNCYFAQQILEQGVAQDTGLSKNSGFCQYPLWQFNEDFLREIGGANYEEYVRQFDAYMPFGDFEEDEEEDFTETAGMVME